jgi:uncharacterized protein YraI
MWKPALLGLGATIAFATAAFADISATAITDLNMRAGPGPEYPVVGVINANDSVIVTGCIDGSKWCTVNYGGMIAWSYSDYLAANTGGTQVVLAQRPATLVPNVVFSGPTVAAPAIAAGATIGAVTAGPAGAAVGAAAGAAVGGNVTIASIAPPPAVRTYVVSNPATNVYLNGEVVLGATLPMDITIVPVPQYQYAYVTVNGLPVLVDPTSRRIVYIFRG